MHGANLEPQSRPDRQAADPGGVQDCGGQNCGGMCGVDAWLLGINEGPFPPHLEQMSPLCSNPLILGLGPG